MIKKFTAKRHVLFVPASWLNAVANVLNQFRSPRGTVSAKLEGGDEGSNMQIDIVPEAAARELRNELARNFVCKDDSTLLGAGLKWGERGLEIDLEWLAHQVVKV